MSQNRLLMALIGSVIVGVFAIVLSAMSLRESQSKKMIQVVSATQAIAAGTPVTTDRLKIVEIPFDSLPIGAFQAKEPILGRVSKININADQIILDPMLYVLGADGGLAYVITKGKRAITLNVNEISDVAGFVLPGNYVDVLVSTKNNTGPSGSKILLQRIPVLAVAQDRLLQGDTKAKVVNAVTLEVTPEEAAAIDAARTVGVLSLTLRNQGDNEVKRSEEPAPTKEAKPTKFFKPVKTLKETPVVAPQPTEVVTKVEAVAKPEMGSKSETPAKPETVAPPHEPGVQVIRGTTVSVESGFKS